MSQPYDSMTPPDAENVSIIFYPCDKGPLLLTWFNFNPAMGM